MYVTFKVTCATVTNLSCNFFFLKKIHYKYKIFTDFISYSLSKNSTITMLIIFLYQYIFFRCETLYLNKLPQTLHCTALNAYI